MVSAIEMIRTVELMCWTKKRSSKLWLMFSISTWAEPDVWTICHSLHVCRNIEFWLRNKLNQRIFCLQLCAFGQTETSTLFVSLIRIVSHNMQHNLVILHKIFAKFLTIRPEKPLKKGEQQRTDCGIS